MGEFHIRRQEIWLEENKAEAGHQRSERRALEEVNDCACVRASTQHCVCHCVIRWNESCSVISQSRRKEVFLVSVGKLVAFTPEAKTTKMKEFFC